MTDKIDIGAEGKRFRATVKHDGASVGDLPWLEEFWAVRYEDYVALAASLDECKARLCEVEVERDALITGRDMLGNMWANAKSRAEAAEAKLAELEPKDGRPCATDEFLAVILDELDDNWDIFEAIRGWVEGDWVNAVQGTTIAELKGESDE
jgi:hypothetical protein